MYPPAYTPPMLREGRLDYPLSIAKRAAFELRSEIITTNHFYINKIVIAGSILRKKEFVHDIDIVINSQEEKLRTYCAYLIHAPVMYQKISGIYKNIPCQIWFCNNEQWAPMLLEITGPRNFNQFLRNCAKRQGLYLSSKGLFTRNSDGTPGTRVDNNTEGNIIWTILGKAWIPPEKRF